MNKLHTLKHGNNAEIVKDLVFNEIPDLEILFPENTFLASRASHTLALSLSLLKFEKRFRKGY